MIKKGTQFFSIILMIFILSSSSCEDKTPYHVIYPPHFISKDILSDDIDIYKEVIEILPDLLKHLNKTGKRIWCVTPKTTDPHNPFFRVWFEPDSTKGRVSSGDYGELNKSYLIKIGRYKYIHSSNSIDPPSDDNWPFKASNEIPDSILVELFDYVQSIKPSGYGPIIGINTLTSNNNEYYVSTLFAIGKRMGSGYTFICSKDEKGNWKHIISYWES